MFGRQPHRLAQTQGIGLQSARVACLALGLVDAQDHPRRFLAQDLGKNLVRRCHPHAAINQEEADIGHIHRAFGQAPHPALKAVVGDLLKPRRVNHGEAQVKKLGIPLAQIACHAGLVIHQCQLAAHKPIEQGRFSHIGAAYDGQRKAHDASVSLKPPPLQGFGPNGKREVAHWCQPQTASPPPRRQARLRHRGFQPIRPSRHPPD